MKTFTSSVKSLVSLLLVLAFSISSPSVFAQVAAANPSAIVIPVTTGTVALSQTGGSNGGYSWSVSAKPAGAPASGDVSISGQNATNGTATATFTNTAVAGTYTFKLTQGATNSTVDVTAVTSANAPLGCSGKFLISYGTSNASTSTTNLAQLIFSSAGVINTTPYSTSPGSIGFNGTGINPIDGYIYGLRYPANSSSKVSLVKIGVGGTNITDLGQIVNATMPNNTLVYAGDFDANGTFYFVDVNNRFYSMSNAELGTTRNATYIGTLNGTGNNAPPGSNDLIADLGVDPVNGNMYAVSISPSFKVFKVNRTNGALTAVGGANTYPHPANAYLAALFFTSDGSFYGYRSDGTFQKIDTSTAATTQVGTASNYTYADGCSCSYRVGHTLTAGAFCYAAGTPTPDFPLNIVINNNSGTIRSGLTFTLDISDPGKRFRFTDAANSSTPASAATIAQSLFNAGLLPNNSASNVTLSTVAPATGTDYNKIVISNFQVPFGAASYAFALRAQLYTTGGTYSDVPIQSIISGLPAGLGSTDLSGNGVQPYAPTVLSITNCQGGPLPLTLLSFTGTLKKNTAQLYWETENQLNSDHFDIERSTNGNDFTTIGVQAALGNNSGKQNYQFFDDLSNQTGKIFYYRLRIVDIDGKFTYSNTILIRKESLTGSAISISPNPVNRNGTETIRFVATATGIVNFRVIDITGKILLQQQNKAYEGVNSITLNNISQLQSGVYVLEMNDGSSAVTTRFTVLQ